MYQSTIYLSIIYRIYYIWRSSALHRQSLVLGNCPAYVLFVAHPSYRPSCIAHLSGIYPQPPSPTHIPIRRSCTECPSHSSQLLQHSCTAWYSPKCFQKPVPLNNSLVRNRDRPGKQRFGHRQEQRLMGSMEHSNSRGSVKFLEFRACRKQSMRLPLLHKALEFAPVFFCGV